MHSIRVTDVPLHATPMMPESDKTIHLNGIVKKMEKDSAEKRIL